MFDHLLLKQKKSHLLGEYKKLLDNVISNIKKNQMSQSIDQHIHDVCQKYRHYRQTKHRGDVLEILASVSRLEFDPSLTPKQRLRSERLVFDSVCSILEIERCVYREVVKIVQTCCVKSFSSLVGCLLS